MSEAVSLQPAARVRETRRKQADTAPASFKRVLVAVDASDQANQALKEAVRLAASAGGVITGIHVYAAKLHDRRFRQMEGGLPERYRDEGELERQREVHDDLITRGLNVISDSYHDDAAKVCEEANVPYRRLSPEGKNYRRIAEAVASGEFDVLALGAVGLGAVPDSAVGTVCERVARLSPIDVLVVRDPERALGEGPLVVGVDGSARSFGALKTALDIGRRLGAPVHAVAAYDPYFHYVAFHRIAGVLNDEAGKVFRFREQEKLHEELIDDGLAKIYRSHLEVARAMAQEEGVELTPELLDGKPYQAIGRYLETVGASMVLLGKTGIHADAELDIGGTAENLVRTAPCQVWLGQVTFTPPADVIARETTFWTAEAEEKVTHVPEVARGMVRTVVVRYAQERGHTVITSSLVDEAAKLFCPVGHDGASAAKVAPTWSHEATALLDGLGDPSLAASIRLRAEKRACRKGSATVRPEHVRPFLDGNGVRSLTWAAAALARLARLPAAAREAAREHIETHAHEREITEITLDVAEAGLIRAKQGIERAMKSSMGPAGIDEIRASSGEKRGSACPFADLHGAKSSGVEKKSSEALPFEWTPEAEERMEKVPHGFMRALTRQRIEAFAGRHNVRIITPALIDAKYAEWAAGSAKQEMSLKWEETALERIDRIPSFVRGMVILEVERCAREMGKDTVSGDVIDRANGIWEKSGAFHSETNPDFYE